MNSDSRAILSDLIPTLLSLSTNVLSYSSLTVSLQQVCTYVQRFKNRLSAANMLHLKRLVVFLDALKKAASEWRDQRVAALKNKQQKLEKSEVLTVVDFMGRLGKKASSINLLEIESYLKKSKVGTILNLLRGRGDKVALHIRSQERFLAMQRSSQRRRKLVSLSYLSYCW